MDIVGIIIVFGVVLISMVLHEMAHAYTAYFLGDTTAKAEGRLSPNPLKHIDPWMSLVVPVTMYIISRGSLVFGGAKPVPINSRRLKGGAWGMALVGFAGPLTNLVLAFVSFLIWYFSGTIHTGGVMSAILSTFVFANLGFFVFNMLPIPPLDGSRVLYAISPDFVRQFMAQMEQGVGMMIVVILVVFFGTYLGTFLSGAINGIFNAFLFLVGAA